MYKGGAQMNNENNSYLEVTETLRRRERLKETWIEQLEMTLRHLS